MDAESPVAVPARRTLLGVLRDTTFRSLRHRNYRLYFAGQIVSLTGSWMQSAALMWLVYDLTADPLWPPLMLVAQIGPTLLLGTVSGTLADRLPKKNLVYGTQIAFLLSAVMLTLLVASDLVWPWLLFGVAVLNGVIQAVDLPVRLAWVPDLIPKADIGNAVALNSLLFNAARAVGPALSGGLFLLADWMTQFLPGSRAVTLGAMWCFALNAISYLAVLLALRAITATETGERAMSRSSPFDGFRYVVRHPKLGMILLLTGVVSVFGWPTLTLFPPYTKLVLEHAEKEYSLLVSALGTGALVAALANATFGSAARQGWFLVAGAVLTAVGIFGLAGLGLIGWQSLPAAAVAAGVFGCGMILYLSTGQTILQTSVTDDMRGRVVALWPMTLSASSLVGQLAGGWAAKVVPLPTLFLIMGSGVAAGAIAAVWMTRTWRK